MNDRQIALYADTAKIVKARGGKLLSSEYIRSDSPVDVRCASGHCWKSSRDALKDGDWCPRCAGRGRSREEVAAFARERGGDLVSTHFLKVSDKYIWRCVLGHEWKATANNVIHNGRWCPTCGREKSAKGRRQYTIEDLKKWAEDKNGECLAESFTSVTKKVQWKCSCGHMWVAEPRRIRDGGWCPECAKRTRGQKRRRHTQKSLDQFARDKGGRCLPPKTFNVKTPVTWKCAEGHHWKANADNVVNGGKWCPICAGNTPLSIEEMRELAHSRHGECLSRKYVNTSTKLRWACSEGHEWSAVPSSIKRGGWCPYCSAGLGERICREHFEQLLKAKFPKARPTWLRSSEGYQLELDGFCEELNLAFEHQGSQHSREIRHFHRSQDDLETQIARDEEKAKLCKDNGVDLISVPSVLEELGVDRIPSFIAAEMKRFGRNLPKSFAAQKINYSNAYKPDQIEILKEVARKKNGKLLSTTYLGIFEKLDWLCHRGHQFSAVPNNVKNSGSWCPTCYGRGQTIIDMQKIAVERGGACLSSEYLNNTTPLVWQCKVGHKWKARPSNVKFGTWCPECARKEQGVKRRKYNIEYLQEIAQKLGGTCVSSQYLGCKKRHRWKCNCGVTFEKTAEQVIREKSWCKKCRVDASCTSLKQGLEQHELIEPQKEGSMTSTDERISFSGLQLRLFP